MKVNFSLSLEEKLQILSDAAKYDVACTSSGSDRRGKKGSLGNSCAAGICHSFAADGRCISLLKVLLSNECVYDCKYCLNRRSNDKVRTTFTPEELCSITMEFYKRNYIEGLFLSSGVIKTPTHTMELMYQTLYLLRTKYHFRGYIHAKAVPGASPEIIEQTGYLADRMSINMELPTEKSLHTLAPGKTQESIVKPMSQIQRKIVDYRLSMGKTASMERFGQNQYLSSTIFTDTAVSTLSGASPLSLEKTVFTPRIQNSHSLSVPIDKKKPRPFVPAGQSTQMIIGATAENDYELLQVTQQLYQKFDLKRVFFSAYIPLNEDSALPSLDTAPPLLREHRLYQADWLLRYYGFHAEDLLSPTRPNFNILLDPKCDWALRHLEIFPVEVSTASYGDLLKVPGIGNKSAWRIVQARRQGTLDFPALKKMGIVLKRAQYFITCQGKMLYRTPIEEDFITRQLTGIDKKTDWEVEHPQTYEQLSLFDHHFLETPPTVEDSCKTFLGQL
ncbi:MAG TPA: putative DNA modification/repair radical SAM protein [Candidatus Blautia stercoravium]|nr:putative DNA modification/repair radical SAM protein [Candidatus Blautia stercoravium]